MPHDRKTEDEWFARNERELIQGLKRERARREKELAELLKQEAAKKRKKMHWMKCPNCGSNMVQHQIEGSIVEKCTLCEGIFLERNEFEDLVLKSMEERRSFVRRLLHLFTP